VGTYQRIKLLSICNSLTLGTIFYKIIF
jgi:hypothetical protein